MTFFIQHGYGKGSKIDDVHNTSGAVAGVILSAADEDPTALAATVQRVRSLGARPLLDPQSYVYSTNPPGVGRRHEANGLGLATVTWAMGARPAEIRAVVDAVQAANVAIGTQNDMIAPTCVQSTFSDVWTPLALQMANVASDEWGPDATMATLCIEESAFASWSTVADWLDVATQLDVKGFYLLVDRRKSSYPFAPWDAARLANVLRLIYTLTELNDYEVIWGYADLDGTLGVAAGATGAGSGWSYTLRAFSVSKWQPTTGGGGKPATARLFLGRLWAPVRAVDEAADIFDSDDRDAVFPQWAIDRFQTEPFTTWTNGEAQIHHLNLLSRRFRRLASKADVADRCDTTADSLTRADALFGSLAQNGVVLPPAYRARARAYREALDLFRTAEGF